MTGRVGTEGHPSPLVTVSMPAYRCGATLRRAVDSVLGQTFRRLQLVVVNDGDRRFPWHVLADIDDPRLIRFDLTANRGRYFADAVTLAAAQTTWWTPHDADDWSDPQRLAKLRSQSRSADVVFGPVVVHDGDRVVVKTPRLDEASKQLRNLGNHVALWRADALRSIGGPHPDYVVGFDTMMVGLAALHLRCRQIDEPLYHVDALPTSMSRSPRTGMRSSVRRQAHRQRRVLWAKAMRVPADRWPDVLAPRQATATAVSAAASKLRRLL